MHTEAIKSIARKLVSAADNLVFAAGKREGTKIVGVGTDRDAFTSNDEGIKAEDDAVATMLKDREWRSKVTEKFLRNRINEMMRDAIKAGTNDIVPKEVEKLITEVEGMNRELLVIVPLNGIYMQTPELRMGNVLLRNVRGEAAKELEERCRAFSMKNTFYSEEEKVEIAQHMHDGYVSKLLNKTCAEVRIVAESDRAEEYALEATRSLIDMLRFAILMVEHRYREIQIGIQGEAPEG